MKRRFFCIYLFLVIIYFPSQAQFYADNSLTDTAEIKYPMPQLGIRFNSMAFFKNNEYFHPLAEGYTLPGFYLQPRFYYAMGRKFSLEAGVHLSQFSGKEGLNDINPLFRAVYTPSERFSVLLGWLKGTTNHQLTEPLYQWEKMYTKPLEYGVQFLVTRPGYKMDTWIDWEKYIELNDPFQEELTFGTVNKVLIFENEQSELWVPFQATIKHKGGQVIAVDEPLTTHANWATGFNLVYNRKGRRFKRLLIDLYYVGFQDFSPQKRMPFKSGYGWYPTVTANISSFTATLGYWRGHRFISSWGEPLFQSVSLTNSGEVRPDSYMIPIKASYYRQIFGNVSFGAYFESYYDIKLSQMDYAYGISMTVSGEILLKPTERN